MLLAVIMVLSIAPINALVDDASPYVEALPLSSVSNTPMPPRAQDLIGAGGLPTGYLIYPTPQSIQYLAGGFVMDAANVIITPGASDATRNRITTILEDAGISNITISQALILDRRNTNVILGIVDDCPQITAYFDAINFADTSALDPVPGTYDGYVLGMHNNDIIIMGRCATSLFYGVMTLRQMLAHGTTLRNVLINDFADTEVRGVVEGFYGVPWSHETRLNMLEMMGENRLNVFVYAPKDDPYHFGPGWYREYPLEMQQEFRELVEVANANHVSFVWTVHVSPHMDFFNGDDEFNATRPIVQGRQWTENDRRAGRSATAVGNVGSPTPQNSVDFPIFASQRFIDTFCEYETFERMYSKFDHMYDLGIRQFGFLIDDINFEEARFNTLFHVTAANRLVAWGERQESEIGPLLLCPAYYYQQDIQSGIPWSGRTSMRTLRGDPWAPPVVVVPAFASGGPAPGANNAGGGNQEPWPEWVGDEVTYEQPGLHPDIQIFYTGTSVMSNIFGNSMRWFYGDHVQMGVGSLANGRPGQLAIPAIGSTWGYPATAANVANVPAGNVVCPPGHPDSCDRCVEGSRCRWEMSGMSRRPLVWWNYPVHDYDGNNIRLFMGPTPVLRNAEGEVIAQSLNPDTKGTIQGLVSNPMQQGHLSEVSLFGVADFTWNMSDFDPIQNWEDSFHYLFPEVAESVLTFSQHNQWRVGGTPMFNNVESTELLPYLIAFLDTVSENADIIDANPYATGLMNLANLIPLDPALLDPAEVRAAGADLLAELAAFEAASLDILENGSDLLLHDIGPWAEKAVSIINTIRAIMDMYDAYFDNDPVATWENYTRALAEQYNWPNIVAPMLNDGVIIVEIGTQRIRPFVNFLFAASDALMEYYSPVDVRVREDSVFTNIPALQNEPIDIDELTRTLSLEDVESLGVHRYVGIQLDNLRRLADIEIEGILSAGLVVEYSANGAEWAGQPETFTGQPIRYIRILNHTDAAISIADLDAISVTVRPGIIPTGTVTTICAYGLPLPHHEQHVAANLITYSLNPSTVANQHQSFWMSRLQYPGDTINIRYDEPQTVHDIALYSDNGDNILAGRILASADGENWTQIMAIGADISLEPFYGRNYIVERAFLGADGMTIQYIQIINDTPRNGWMRLHSFRLNERAGYLHGTVPNTALENGQRAPTVVDGRMNTLLYAETANTLTYTLHESTNATELIVLQNISYVNNAPIRALTEDGWIDLGVLDSAFWRHDISQFGRLLQVEISWDEATAPVMIHAIGTVADIDKAALLDRMAVVEADEYLSNRLALELLMAEAVADDPHASTRDVAIAHARLFIEARLITLEVVGETLTPAFDPDVFGYAVTVAHNVTEITLRYTASTGATVAMEGPVDDLAVGSNTITLTVTSGDGVTVEVYTIVVTRMETPVVTHAITLRLAGGTWPTGFTPPATAVNGAPMPAIPTPVRDGFTFTGWTPVLPETVTRPVTATAQWTAIVILEPEFDITVDDEYGELTITVDPDGDYEVTVDEDGNIVITLPDANPGNEIVVNLPDDWDYDVTEDEDGNVIVVITPPEGYEIVEGEDGTLLVRPVREFHPAYMFGVRRDGTLYFDPTANITRAQVAAILARTMIDEFDSSVHSDDYELPEGMESFDEFSDVAPNNWFYHYVAWAYHEGLVQGIGSGRFAPNALITREQLAAMLVRTLDVEDRETAVGPTVNFPDAGTISTWAPVYVYNAFRQGWMIGDANNNFRPVENIMRAEVATAVNRMLSRVDHNDVLRRLSALLQHEYRAATFPDVMVTNWFFASVLGAANDHYLSRDGEGDISWKYIRVQPE